MYCCEECRDCDWRNDHKDYCYFICCFCVNLGLGTDKLSELGQLMSRINQKLYTYFGVEYLKRAAQHNEPMAVSSNPRTRGFSNGKFNNATLEAFMSLEDNMDKLNEEEIDIQIWVILKRKNVIDVGDI